MMKSNNVLNVCLLGLVSWFQLPVIAQESPDFDDVNQSEISQSSANQSSAIQSSASHGEDAQIPEIDQRYHHVRSTSSDGYSTLSSHSNRDGRSNDGYSNNGSYSTGNYAGRRDNYSSHRRYRPQNSWGSNNHLWRPGLSLSWGSGWSGLVFPHRFINQYDAYQGQYSPYYGETYSRPYAQSYSRSDYSTDTYSSGYAGQVVIAQAPKRVTTSVQYAPKGLKSLPENARAIVKNGKTIYEWQGTEYQFNWATETYDVIDESN